MVNGKRGDFIGLLYFIVMISAFAFFLLIVGYIAPQINDGVKAQIGASTLINNTIDASSNVAHNTLNTLWFVMLGGLLISLMITAYFIPTHPIFIVPFIILMLVSFIVSIAMSNAYESLLLSGNFVNVAAEQNQISFVMLNLPYFSLIVGILILVISFAKPLIIDKAFKREYYAIPN